MGIKSLDELIPFAVQRSSEDNSYVDARYGEFKGHNLEGLNLSGFDFTGSSLEDSDLSRCNLKRALFVQADVSGTNFVGADLAGALFQGTIATGAYFGDTSSFEAQFIDCVLKNTHFGTFSPDEIPLGEMKQFVGCDFRGAYLSREVFLKVLEERDSHRSLHTLRLKGGGNV